MIAKELFANCPVKNCEVVNDKTLIGKSDAVVFHAWDTKTEKDLPSKEVRTFNQRWVFFNNEPPSMTQQVHSFNNVFNITMTYRRDSDVFNPYGKIVKNTKEDNAHTRSPALSKLNFADGKTKLATWFVSACDVKSKRQLYVKELQKHMKVDIYGKCGNMNITCAKYTDECFKYAEKMYKFYFAFENSICPDYITEKVFYIMRYNIVPVVLGGDDYAKSLPAKSYIHIKDFATPQTLAEYLKKLDTMDELYNEYFEWKNKYKVVLPSITERMCSLCVYLKDHKDEKKTHKDLGQWWDRCYDAKDYYSGMGISSIT